MWLKLSLTTKPLRLFALASRNSVAFRSSSTATTTAEISPEDWAKAKPFSKLPGPSLFEMIRLYMPGGALDKTNMNEMLHYMHDKYGTVCKLPAMFGKPAMALTFDPEYSQLIYRTEGQWPLRRGMDTFTYYRTKVRPEVFGDMGGLVSDQGETWYKMRSKVNPVMMQPRSVKSYVAPVDAISREFVQKMALLRDDRGEMPANFSDDLAAWALESIGVIALDRRLGALAFDLEPRTSQLIKAVREFFRLSYLLEFKPSIWRIYKTKNFRDLMAAFDVMTDTVMHHIDSSIVELDKANQNATTTGANQSEESVLQRLLKIDRRYAILMTFDMLFAGIDTTSATSAILLYMLALNPDKQDKLRAEIMHLLPTVDSEMTEQSLNNSPYFRAALKESMRMHPITGANLRGAGKDIVLGGYQIPKDTDIVMGNVVMTQSDTYYPDSGSFQPERFLRDAHGNTPQATPNSSPFVFLPFGFGTRMCIGKRFAELEIQLLVTRILREYRVEWHHGPMEFENAIITSPASDLRFRMIPLEQSN